METKLIKILMKLLIPILPLKPVFLLLCLFSIVDAIQAQQVTEVITDYNNFWKSGTAALNPVYPNTSHNVLCFKYNNVNYSTGVNNTRLTDSSITYTAANFQAFPVATVGGVVVSGVYIALAGNYDGVPNGYSNPLPSLKIKDVLIDGIHGLDLGTGVTNVPASALINFPVNSITSAAITDAEPDILVSQIASPSSNGDTLYFVNSSGTLIGNKIPINWTLYNPLGTYTLDLYALTAGALCDTAKISGTNSFNTTREIRLIALKLSDFGITTGNAASVSNFILKASGTSDPAFVAYNAGSFSIPAPVITVQPVTQIICPNVSNSVTLSVTATGTALTYQWRRNGTDITGATSSTYTISNVVNSSAGAYTVIVSNSAGSVSSEIAYLNITIAVQPSPSTQTIATGAADTLSISANNASSYQWKRNGTDISGATGATYILNPVTTTNAGNYTVQIINAANGGCTNILSSAVAVVAATTLYSKAGVSLNIPGSWGVATNGTGSSPVDFSRGEHTFIVKNNASTGGNLTIAGTLDVANAVTTISANTTLDAGRIIRSGAGSLAGSSTSNLTVRDTSNIYFKTGNNILHDFTIQGGNVSLLGSLSITAGTAAGTLALNGGKINTSDSLTFKSDSAGTARLAPVNAGAIINGKATIERYVSSNRGWRLLSVPVGATNVPTINEAWQEGLTTASANPNLYPGYGIKIAGGTTTYGFDQSNTNASFIKVYNNATNSSVALPSIPGTNIPITTNPAYFVYIRGDRSIDLMQGLNAAITSTTLRMKGGIKTGDQPVAINAANCTLVGNPYPSTIDFGSLTKSNVNNTMYMWDPKMAGNYGLGGYVTISWNTNTNKYDKTSSVAVMGQYIQSGEAFFVASTDKVNPGTITIKESDKTTLVNLSSSRTQGVDQKVRIDLYAIDSSNNTSLLDGILTTYADDNVNEVDQDDPQKIYSSNQSINIRRDGQTLAIERRKTIAANDTTFLNLVHMKAMNYQLEITAVNMTTGNIIAVIKDNYSNTINNTFLDMNGITLIPFSLNTDPGSYAVDRFSIVYKMLSVLPVAFETIKAYRNGKDIEVDWSTSGEININHYDVERAADGKNFNGINTTAAIAINGAKVFYKVLDTDPLPADNYYRIRSVSNYGNESNSTIVKVSMKSVNDQPAIAVFPNPAIGNKISFRLNNLKTGTYNIQLYNHLGAVVATKTIEHNGLNSSPVYYLNNKLGSGEYELKLKGTNIILSTPVIKK